MLAEMQRRVWEAPLGPPSGAGGKEQLRQPVRICFGNLGLLVVLHGGGNGVAVGQDGDPLRRFFQGGEVVFGPGELMDVT